MVIAHAHLVERSMPDLTAQQVAETTNRTKALARDTGIRYLDRCSSLRRAAASACSPHPRLRRCGS